MVYSQFGEGAGEADDAAGSWRRMWRLWTRRRTAGDQSWTLRPASGPAVWPGPSSPPGSEDEALRSGLPGSTGNAGPRREGEEGNTDGCCVLLNILYASLNEDFFNLVHSTTLE